MKKSIKLLEDQVGELQDELQYLQSIVFHLMEQVELEEDVIVSPTMFKMPKPPKIKLTHR